VLLFLFVQNPKLALAAIIFFPAQVWLVPFIQKRINVLNQARVKHMRVIGVQVTEASTQTNPDSLERVAEEFQERQAMIFRGRIHIYRLKYRLKFLNNLFAQLTPLLFYAVGGWLVIHERLTLGALVAALSAHKHLIAPWKELLDFYQSKENGRVRYEMLRSQFGE
jgi:ABC-type bacteriocin/lantibiotic exporter with double-glycine peptidase domain